jgi:succinylglutamate desuccinylase
VYALERVTRVLVENRAGFRGRFVALAGNVAALQTGSRFRSRDLNRLWMPENLAALKGNGTPQELFGEEQEQAGLVAELDLLIEQSDGPIFVLDLHTTSVRATPFAVVTEDDQSRSFAADLPIPVIIGLTRHLDGTLMEYVSDMGHVPMAVEGGRHDSDEAARWLEAATWLAMDAANMLTDEFSSRLAIARTTLGRVAEGPRELEVRYRHAILPEDEFRMRPGFENFQEVEQGEILAHDRRGEIRAPTSGRILMPLYQDLGDDGFFVGRVCDQRRTWRPFSRR